MDHSVRPTGARPPLAAAVIALFAGVMGVARATGFDEKAQAPRIKESAELGTVLRGYSQREANVRAGGIVALVRNRSLSRERFDASWDLQRAVDTKLPLGDISELGLVDRGDGSYGVDLTAHPQWGDPAMNLTGLLPALDRQSLVIELTRRGMRPDDLTTLESFWQSHDVKAAIASATLPINVAFSRIVRKFDKLKRPVPDALVLSYLYQREAAGAEAQRQTAEMLLDALSPGGVRVIESYLGELQNTGVYGPTDQRAGIDGVLADMRLPDFERRAATEAGGVSP